MNQPTMEDDMAIPASMLTVLTAITSTPGDDPTPNPTMTPMLHQATPADDELADEETQQKDQPETQDSEKDPTNGKNRKSREDQQIKFMETTTLDDVLVDDSVNTKVGKNDSDTTHLISIKGCCPKKLSMACLRKFCMVHSISGYKNLAKTRLCNLIVERMKTRGLDEEMYSGDFEKNKEMTKKKKLNKNAKPSAVTTDDSFWRAISTYFLQTLRPHVIKLGNNPDISNIDQRKFLHEDIWNLIAAQYNQEDHPDLRTFLKNDVYYESCEIPEDIVRRFNVLSSLELSQLMAHIHDHYKKAIRNMTKSGSHLPFQKFCGTRPWLLLYHQNIVEAPVQMWSYISGDLPDEVGGSSLKKKRLADDTGTSEDEGNPRAKKKNKEQDRRVKKPENEKMRVARAMEVVGEAAKERTAIFKGQTLVTTRHGSAEAYGRFQKSVREGRADLRVMREQYDYDSESSEAKCLKETVAFFKEEARIIFDELEHQKKSFQTISTTEGSSTSSRLSDSSHRDSSSSAPRRSSSSAPRRSSSSSPRRSPSKRSTSRRSTSSHSSLTRLHVPAPGSEATTEGTSDDDKDEDNEEPIVVDVDDEPLLVGTSKPLGASGASDSDSSEDDIYS